MKFSTTFTLAALMLMSSGTDARIGGNQRELHSHSRKEKKCDPNIAGQCFTNGKYTGSDCKNVKLGGSRPDYRCVGPADDDDYDNNKDDDYDYDDDYDDDDDDDDAPAPAPKKPIKCHTDQNPTYTPECPSGYTCEPI